MDFSEYAAGIEDAFVNHRGKPTLLRPNEWAQIEQWHAEGIPFEVVLRGIRQAFESKRDGRINSLTYCAREVKAALDDWEKTEGRMLPRKLRGETL